MGGYGSSIPSQPGFLARTASGLSSPGIVEEEGTSILLGHAEELLSRLKKIGEKEKSRKGKEKEVERGDEVGEVLVNLSGMFKRSDELKMVVDKDDLIRW
jgi:hypothetical protein